PTRIMLACPTQASTINGPFKPLHPPRSRANLASSNGRCGLALPASHGGRPRALPHKGAQLSCLLSAEAQAKFGAPPQHVLGGHRPFLIDEIAHLRLGQGGPKLTA